MDFTLFILLNAVLFIRPAELVPDAVQIPFYYIVIVACVLVTLPRLISQLTPGSLAANPISLCVMGLMVAVPVSQLIGNSSITGAVDVGVEFFKTVIYYLLTVANLRTPERLRSFVGWLCVLFATVSLIAVLHYYDIISVPGIKVMQDTRTVHETGERISFMRLVGTGLFGDPNDLSMLTVLGSVLTCYACFTPRWRYLLPASVATLALFFYALVLTSSRGGLLAFLAASCALLQSRFGWKRTMPLLLLAVAALPLAISGRQADIGGAVGKDTGQSRIQLWAEGLRLFRESPLFGVGTGMYEHYSGQVAHNSFVHAYAELGYVGGTLFLAAFLYPIWALYRLGNKRRVMIEEPILAAIRPFLLAGILGYAAGLLSLSRSYVVPTYMVLGLGASYLRMAEPFAPCGELLITQRLVLRMIFISVVFLMATYIFVRVFVNYG